jgi:hypothetical protein
VTEEHFIFPLGTVLYPGGMLPLRIFEQRYLEMTKTCIRDERPFGVCLIKEGAEVGTPAVPHRIGCLATIESWDMAQLGVFELLTRGTERFRLLESTVAPNGLMNGTIERIADVPAPMEPDEPCREVLKLLIERVGEQHFPQPIRLDDPAWVSYRLPEILPLDSAVKQMLLETDDVGERLRRLRGVLEAEGLIAQSSPK